MVVVCGYHCGGSSALRHSFRFRPISLWPD
jgi:hypothetical protein